MSSRLVRLYPAPWRARYGDEFEAILESRRMTPLDTLDVIRGALDARLHPRRFGDRPPASLRGLRVGGYAAIWAGILWPGGIALQVLGGEWSNLGLTAHLFGTLAILIAVVALSSAEASGRQALAWAAAVVPVLGCLLVFASVAKSLLGVGPFDDETGWQLWFLGMVTMVFGSILFALAVWRVGRLSRRGAALISIGSAAVVLSGLLGWSGILEVVAPVAFLVLPLLALGWVLLGISAYRLGQDASADAASA